MILPRTVAMGVAGLCLLGGLLFGQEKTADPVAAAETPAAIAVAPAPVLAPEPLPPLRDPLEPVNRVFFHFNDKLYFWVLKPVAQGYKYVVPQPARVCVRNFFTNVQTPVRLVNCVLQIDLTGAGAELARFGINSTLGVAGFWDIAGHKWDIKLRDEDLGQTLGFYGMPPWVYLNWPVFGPSCPRDTMGLVGDTFLDPLTYAVPKLPPRVGVRAYDRINATSLRIGDYEDLNDSALDPYVAVRDAYQQYRYEHIQPRRAPPPPPSPEPAAAPVTAPPETSQAP